MMNEGFWVGFTVYYNAAFRSRFPTTLINVYGPEQGPGATGRGTVVQVQRFYCGCHGVSYTDLSPRTVS